MKMEAEKGETHLQTKEHQGFLATSDASRQAWHWVSLRASRKKSSLTTCWFQMSVASTTVRARVSVLSCHQLVAICHGSPRKVRKPPSTSVFPFRALISFKAVTVPSTSPKGVIENFWWLTSQLTLIRRQNLGEHLKKNVKDARMLGYGKTTLPFKMWLAGWI